MVKLLKIKAQVSSIWDKGCMFDDCLCLCVCYDLIYYPSLMEGECHGILLLLPLETPDIP